MSTSTRLLPSNAAGLGLPVTPEVAGSSPVAPASSRTPTSGRSEASARKQLRDLGARDRAVGREAEDEGDHDSRDDHDRSRDPDGGGVNLILQGEAVEVAHPVNVYQPEEREQKPTGRRGEKERRPSHCRQQRN